MYRSSGDGSILTELAARAQHRGIIFRERWDAVLRTAAK
jgi:hypothetical protein